MPNRYTHQVPCTAEAYSALLDVLIEHDTAASLHPPFSSAHEGYSVLAEEVDELWEHVKVKQGKRDVRAMYAEAIQVAAMALRFAIDLGNEERGQR